MSPAESSFGMLDVIGNQLEKHKDRLGPFYQPLYLLSGAVAFLLCLAFLIGLPVYWFEDFVYVALIQIFLVAVYFMLLLTIQQNVFDRFVYATTLLLVACAAPVLISSQAFLDLVLVNVPPGFPETIPRVEVFLYSVLRGMGNLGWSLPVLLYFFTFYPRLAERPDPAFRRAFHGALATGAVLHLIAMGLLFWQDGVLDRSLASTAGAVPAVAQHIEANQTGYLVFTVLYFTLGFVALGLIWRFGRNSDKKLHVILVAGMAAVQLAFSLATYNVRHLNQRFPASRTSAQAIQAFREVGTDRIVFTHPFFDHLSAKKLGNHWRPYSVCQNPESGKFTYRVAPAREFQPGAEARFREIDLLGLVLEPSEETRARTLFCHSPSRTGPVETAPKPTRRRGRED